MNRQKTKNELYIALYGVSAILILETIALLKGVDGPMFGATAATIGGVVGYLIKSHLKK